MWPPCPPSDGSRSIPGALWGGCNDILEASGQYQQRVNQVRGLCLFVGEKMDTLRFMRTATALFVLLAVVMLSVNVNAAEAGSFELHAVSKVSAEHTKEYSMTHHDGPAETVLLDSDVLLDQTALKGASVEHADGEPPIIRITLTEAGGKRLEEITTENLHKRLGIVLDGQLYAAPIVAMPIHGNSLNISGNFTEAEAAELVEKLNESVIPLSDGDNGPLTATELARQIHVYSWVSKMDLQGHETAVTLLHVVDEKIKSTLLTNGAFPTDRKFERIVVLANQTSTGTKASIQPGSSGATCMSLEAQTDTVPLSLINGLPEIITEGDYLLGGDASVEKLNTHSAVKIDDIKDGLVLSVHRKVFGVDTRERLVSNLTAAFDSHDRAAFEKCVNLDGVDEDIRQSFKDLEDEIFAMPSHYVFAKERIDQGKAHIVKDGKNYTLNGDWTFDIGIYVSKSPSKGFVIPAGVAKGKCQMLLTVEERP